MDTTNFLNTMFLELPSNTIVPEVYLKYIKFIPLFFLSMLVSFLLTPIIGYIANKFNITDDPYNPRRYHFNKFDNPERHLKEKLHTPLLGGIAVVLPVIIYLLIFFKLEGFIPYLLASTLLLFIAAILDDIFNFPSNVQMTMQIIAALIIAFSPINLEMISNPFGGAINLQWYSFYNLIIPGDLLIVAWILICINAIKWVGGSDGLMEGNIIITYILLFVLGIRTDSTTVVVLSTLLAGGLIAFLFYNFPPAKIFSGSAGKTMFGFFVAVLSVVNGAKIATTILILTLPIVDFLFVLAKRYYVHKPKNLIELMRINDRNHLHHQLMEMKLSPKQILLIETSATLFVGALAILTTGAMKFFAIVIFFLIVAICLFCLHVFITKRKNKPNLEIKEEKPESKYSY